MPRFIIESSKDDIKLVALIKAIRNFSGFTLQRAKEVAENMLDLLDGEAFTLPVYPLSDGVHCGNLNDFLIDMKNIGMTIKVEEEVDNSLFDAIHSATIIAIQKKQFKIASKLLRMLDADI